MINPTIAFVQVTLRGAEAGHDWFHTERVYKLSRKIAEKEDCNLLVVELAALLHDIADPKFHDGDETLALKISEEKGAAAISPLDHEAIKAKKYFFQRPLYQFIPEKSWEAAKPFIDFEKTETGKEIIRNSGYYVVD